MKKILLFTFLTFVSIKISWSQTWNTVASGMGNDIHGFTIFNNELIAGGSFNGNPGNHIVSWDGVNWGDFGSGTGKVVRSIVEWNGNLVACGDFWNVGQPCTDCNGIALWNGSSWEAMGTGMNNDVLALTVWNGNLIAAGDFTSVNGDTSIKRVAMWDGVTWSGFHTGFNNDVRALTVYNGELIAGGDFSNASGNGAADRVARWDVGDQEWKKLVDPGGLDSTVRVLRVIGTDLYMGGHFIEVAGNTDCRGIARYDGNTWYPLGTGVNSYVRAIAEYAGEVYIGGDFTMAGSTSANRIARWNGSTWQNLTSGVTAYIRALEVYNGELYVGGSFHEAGGLVADYIARWSMPLPLSSTTSSVNATCSGLCDGEATVAYSGGTGPYSILWSPGNQTTQTVTGLCPGTYSVTITDNNGTTSTQNITITTGSNVSATAMITTNYNGYPVSCFGGSDGTAVASGSGGVAPYTFTWSASAGAQTTAIATGLSAGSHSVTVTDNNGCSSSTSIMITEPSPLQSVITTSDVSCNGGTDGSAVITVTGGVSSYGYQWSPGAGSQTSAAANSLTAGIHSVTVTDLNGCTSTFSTTVNEPALLSGTATVISNVSCNGGTDGYANVTVSGGTSPYLFSWTGGATTNDLQNAGAGIYTVTITDAQGCATAQTITITEPAPISISETSNSSSACNGSTGSSTVAATGGTGSLNYSWNTSPVQTGATASSLSSGNYIVTVTDASGCMEDLTVIIGSTGGPSATISSQSNVSCNGGTDGSATATATGGTAPYSYSWNTSPVQNTSSATGLTAGTYTLNVTDNSGCSTQETVIITEPFPVTLTISESNVDCNSGQYGNATVIVTGGTPGYTYSWNTTPVQNTSTANSLTAGNYSVTVSDMNGCSEIHTVVIGQTGILNGSITTTDSDAGCTGSASAIVSNGSGNYSYLWDAAANSQTTQVAANLCPGSYCVQVTDINGCLFNDCADVLLINGMAENDISGIELFPNPSTGKFFIKSNGSRISSISVIDVTGKEIPSSFIADDTLITIFTAAFEPGMYFVIMTLEDGSLIRRNVVLN